MNEILLTQEELNERSELFEYEMTQVILNLKGKHAKYDRNNSPIKDSQKFAGEILCKHLDFEPLSDVDADIKTQNIPSLNSKADYIAIPDVKSVVEIKTQNIPSLDSKTDYAPLTDVKPIVKVEADKKKVAASKNTLHYKKHKKPKIASISCAVPSKKGVVEYAPFAAEITVPALENETNSELFVRRGINYTPIADTKVKTKDHILPRIGSAVEFSPFTDIVIANQVHFVSNIEAVAAYTPNTEIEIKPISDTNVSAVSIQYMALTDTIAKLPVHSIPSLKTTHVFSPLRASKVKKTKKKIPSGAVSPKFAPIKSIEAIHSDITMPNVNKKIEFVPVSNSVDGLPKIENLKIGKTPDFEPIKISSAAGFTGSVPATKLDVKFTPKKAATAKVRPIDTIPKEVIAPKDFYTMWESL